MVPSLSCARVLVMQSAAMMTKHMIFETLRGTGNMGLPTFVMSSPRNKFEDKELPLTRIVNAILFLFFFRVYNSLYTLHVNDLLPQ